MRRLSLDYLLIFIPIALALYWFQANPLLVFGMAALTIVPLSKIVGSSTETLGGYLGPTLGGLLNASMGNAPELIIGVFALKNGLITVVKACELLHNPYRSIVEISLAVGFSSQSHLTTVFRRFVKTTPAAYREAVLGIRDPEPCARTTQTS